MNFGSPLKLDLKMFDVIRQKFDFLKSYKVKEQKILAINFSETSFEIAHVEILPARFKLLAFESQSISSKDEQYEGKVKTAVHHFLQENMIAENSVIINLSASEHICIKNLKLPDLPDKEILSAAKFQLKDEASFDIESASVDWKVLSEETDDEGAKQLATITIAVDKETLQKMMHLLKKCGLEPVGITHHAFNYLRLLDNLPDIPDSVAILEIGQKGSTLNFYKNKQLHFVRDVPISWEKLIQSLTQTIGSDTGKVALSLQEAESVARSFGIPEDQSQIIQGKVQAKHLSVLLRPFLEVLVREIKFSFDYFSSQFSTELPTALFVTGEGAYLKHLDQYLGKELSTKVSFLCAPENVDTMIVGQIKFEQDQHKILNVLAAAMDRSVTINLLPSEAKRTQQIKQINLPPAMTTAMTLSVITFIFLSMATYQMRVYKKKLFTAKSFHQSFEVASHLNKKVQLKQGLVDKIRANHVPAEGLLKAISSFIPPEIILEDISLNQTAHLLKFTGVVFSTNEDTEDVLFDFLDRLELTSYFSEASLVFTQRQGVFQKFEIKCDLNFKE